MTPRPLHLGLDIDGVLAGYVAAHVAAAPDLVGVTIGADGGDPPTYNMVGEGWYDNTNQWRVVHNIILADPTTFDMTDPTAPESIAALVDAGHRVDLATARHAPTGVDYDDALIAELTERWARSHDLHFHELHLGADKDRHGFDDLLEDSDTTVARFVREGLPITVRDRAYNRHITGARRVHSVAEFAAPYLR